MSQNAGIPKVIIDDAMRYHKKISEYELTFRGDNRDGILAASIYISCRINNFPRTAKEIASIFHLDVTSATKGCKNALAIINNLEKENKTDKIKVRIKISSGTSKVLIFFTTWTDFHFIIVSFLWFSNNKWFINFFLIITK